MCKRVNQVCSMFSLIKTSRIEHLIISKRKVYSISKTRTKDTSVPPGTNTSGTDGVTRVSLRHRATCSANVSHYTCCLQGARGGGVVVCEWHCRKRPKMNVWNGLYNPCSYQPPELTSDQQYTSLNPPTVPPYDTQCHLVARHKKCAQSWISLTIWHITLYTDIENIAQQKLCTKLK